MSRRSAARAPSVACEQATRATTTAAPSNGSVRMKSIVSVGGKSSPVVRRPEAADIVHLRLHCTNVRADIARLRAGTGSGGARQGGIASVVTSDREPVADAGLVAHSYA